MSLFNSDRIKNILKSKKTKAIVVGIFLVAIFSLAFFVFNSDIVSAQGTPAPTPRTPAQQVRAPDGFFSSIGKDIISGALYVVQVFLNKILAMAATIFGVAIAPGNISGDYGILNKPAVGNIWMMTRDTMNMFFILVLLFSAFCTIFQVEKWGLKKIWLNILINALLVNFSFPIARFFIDVSNVAMYYFINNLFESTQTVTGSSIMAMFSATSKISEVLQPGNFSDSPLSYEFAGVIFTFILAITFIVAAFLFVIRLIALTLLVMFSPIGFVGYIFPSTAQYADKWWTNLFNYSFFGPIMIFGMAIALKISQSVSSSAFVSNAQINTTSANDANWVASVAFFFIPVIVLWAVMGIAKSMGIAGADMVVGKAQSFAKSVGMWAAKAPWRAAKFTSKELGFTGAVQQKYANIKSKFDTAREMREAKLASKGPFKVHGAMESIVKKQAEEYKKNGLDKMELRTRASSGDAAAAHRLAEDGDFDAASYSAYINSTAGKAQYTGVNTNIERKLRAKRADVLIDHRINQEIANGNNNLASHISIAQQEIGKLTATQWKDQDWHSMLGHDEKNPGNYFIGAAHSARRTATANAYNSMNVQQQGNVTKDMRGDHYAAGTGSNIGW